MVFQRYLKIHKKIFDELQGSPRHTFKRGTCKSSAPYHYSGYHFSWGDEIILNKPRLPKSWKSWILSFPSRFGSQTTLQKPQSAAPTRNLQITCRGEASTSVSNTPPGQTAPRHPTDFRRILGWFFKDISESAKRFSTSSKTHLDTPSREVHAKAQLQIIILDTTFLWATRLFWVHLGCQNYEKHWNCDF